MKQSSTVGKKLKVLVVYQVVQHYRKAVFVQLTQNTAEIDYEIYAGNHDRDSSIRLLEESDTEDQSSRVNLKALENVWVGRHFLWQKGLVKICASEEYDAIIFLGNMYFLSTWLGAIIAKFRGKKILMWTHGVRRIETGWKRILRLRFYNLADRLLLYGERARACLTAMGYEERRLDVIYNSLDFDRMDNCWSEMHEDRGKIRDKLSVGPNEICLIIVGRLSKNKKPEMLIEAARRLKLDGQPIKILFVGKEENEGELISLSESSGVRSSCFFVGPCYEEHTLAEYFISADICVVPGDIGLTAIHALTYGTPVLTHDDFDSHGPEFEAIEAGVNGDFYRKGDVDSLCKLIRKWSERTLDTTGSVAESYREPVLQRYNPRSQAELITNAVKLEVESMGA